MVIGIEDLAVRRGGLRALDGVTLSIAAGSVVAVIGPNGAGKSTLLGVLAGRIRPDRGLVRVAGTVADVPQTTTIDPEVRLPVRDVVRMGRYPRRGLLGRFGAEDDAAVRAALEAMGLQDLERRSIHALSGGQRQRVLVAQGLAQRADVLLLDEPTAALDQPSRELVLAAARREAQRGTAVLLATHALDEAVAADVVVVLAGRVVRAGAPEEVLHDADVEAVLRPRPLRESGVPVSG